MPKQARRASNPPLYTDFAPTVPSRRRSRLLEQHVHGSDRAFPQRRRRDLFLEPKTKTNSKAPSRGDIGEFVRLRRAGHQGESEGATRKPLAKQWISGCGDQPGMPLLDGVWKFSSRDSIRFRIYGAVPCPLRVSSNNALLVPPKVPSPAPSARHICRTKSQKTFRAPSRGGMVGGSIAL
jgi:hypothetical protein